MPQVKTPSNSSDDQPLKGLRLLVTDLDLQQREHRGIAVYSKALLKALKAAGAETWLLTDFDPPMRDVGLKRLPPAARQLIYDARVMEALVNGPQGLRSPYVETKLGSRSRLASRLWSAWLKLWELRDQLRPRSTYHVDKLSRVNLLAQYDNPYFREERLSYFEHLDGIICARHLYFHASKKALKHRPQPQNIDLGKTFDSLITTCPLNLDLVGGGSFVQTVHDLIPMEYVRHLDCVAVFGQRLASCNRAHKLFVSSATRQKFERAFGHANPVGGAVVVQPPSLQVPEGIQRSLLEQPIRLSRKALGNKSELQSFRYLLFNSSVEARKNLLFAIKAYRLSGLADHGIRLCVTGMLKRDAYSKAVAQQTDESVLLTNYIDEPTKTALFLNALAVLSPSLVEGFGIPVLDGACIGTPVIASPSDSHREIQQLHDFQTLVWLCDTTDPYSWGLAMRDLALKEQARIQDPSSERQRRLERYDSMAANVFETFQATICDQVLAGINCSNNNETLFKAGTEDSGARG